MKKINIAFVGAGFNGQIGHLINFVNMRFPSKPIENAVKQLSSLPGFTKSS